MKIISLSIIVFLLIGCEEINLDDDNATEQTSVINGLPKIYTPLGISVRLENYLYPSSLTENKTIYSDIYPYQRDSLGKITRKNIVERSITKTVADANAYIITEYIDNNKIKSDYITSDKIKITVENKIEEEYPLSVSKNSLVTEITKNNITKRCIIKSLGANDLLQLLPTYIQNDLKQYLKLSINEFELDQFNHEHILHVECGSTDNTTINTYYSDKYGEVLNIEKNTTSNSAYYEIVDIKSIETR